MVALDRWLLTFPSYGFLLSTSPTHTSDVIEQFRRRDIAAARIGSVTQARRVEIYDETGTEIIWDLASRPFIGCGHA